MADPPEYLAVGNAAALAGIPERTLRYWITSGKLPATTGSRGKLVRLADVQRLAALAGRSAATTTPATAANGIAAEVAGDVAATLVPDQARQQLEAIRDEWLLPLVEQIRTLERENGRLEQERNTMQAQQEEAAATTARLRAELATFRAAQDGPQGTQTGLQASQHLANDSEGIPATPAPWWAFWRR